MGTVLLVQVDSQTASLLGPALAVPCVHLTASEGMARLAEDAHGVEALVLGSGLDEPLRLAHRAHNLDPDVGLLLLSDPHRQPLLRRALHFASFPEEAVRCLSLERGEALARDLEDAVALTRRRRTHRRASDRVSS